MNFKSIVIASIMIGLAAGLGASASAPQDKIAAGFTAVEPVLLTSAGQSADAQIVKVLLERNKIAAKSVPLAGPDDLSGVKTLVIAVGGSSKGLGAAGIDVEKELDRVQKVLNRAKEAGIPVLAMHVGGSAKRGEMSDRFISQVIPMSAFLMAIRDGDKDGFLTKTAAKGKVPVQFVDRLSELQAPLKTIFGKS